MKRLVTTLTLLTLVVLPMAAGAATTVTPSNTQGWTIYNTAGGTVEYVNDASAPAGTGSVEFKTPGASDEAQLDRSITPTPIAAITSMSYDTKNTGTEARAAAYVLGIDTNGDTDADIYAWYEPVYNGGTNYDTWQTHTMDTVTTQWWSFDTISTTTPTQEGGANGSNFFTLADVAAAYPTARVVELTLNQGTGNTGWDTFADNVNFNGTTYDFEPAPAAVAHLVITVPDSTATTSALVAETNGKANNNADVETAVSSTTPIAVHLQNTGTATSTYVRISPIGDTSGHIQLWAKDSSNDWYDVNVTGWGPAAGFQVAPGADNETNVFPISDLTGDYTSTVNVVDASTSQTVASTTATVHVVAPAGNSTSTPVSTGTASSASYSNSGTSGGTTGGTTTGGTLTAEATLLPPVTTGQVLGAFTSAENQAQIAVIKQQLATLITQLISLLQAQIAAMSH